MSEIMHNFALQKVQLSEKVHHWTPDGSYGSRDFKFPINVRMNLSSFDVGFLIATIFGKLKLPPKVDLRSEFKDHKFCSLDTQDLYSGKTSQPASQPASSQTAPPLRG